MNRKKMSLRAWMYLKITPAALFLVYYWMCTRRDFRPSYLYLQTAVFAAAGALGAVLLFHGRDVFDEFAKENLRTTDSICLKVAYGLMTAAALACVFADFSGIVAGYCVVGGILLLSLIRAAIFAVLDNRGM